jgi:hypothetical protein
MSTIKRFIKSNQWLFHSMKSTLLYVRYVRSLTQPKRYKGLPKAKSKDCYLIGEKGYHCWFGYYDKSPMNITNRFVAYTKVRQTAVPGDACEVCIYDTQQKASKVVGKTTTWNWQQGCMPQWVDETHLRYNAYDEASKQYITRIVNVESGEVQTYMRACYASNKDHSAYLSLNFYRLDLYAKGYGYPYQVDALVSNTDGIWETTLSDNKAELLIPLQKVIEYNKHYDDDCQHYINHVTYCPDESLIMFIHRWQKTGTEFTSRLLIYDRTTGELDTLLDNGHVSHYCWKSNDVLMIYATNNEGKKGYMTVNIKTKETELIDGLPKEDGHPTYSNDGTTILTDAYPNAHRDQYLFLFDTATKELMVLDKLYSPFKYFNEERCDFHPRWSMDCTQVMIDNTNEGIRTIKVYKL